MVARQALGFAGDRAQVAAFIEDGRDVGSGPFGIPMTASERDRFEDHLEFSHAAHQRLVPSAERVAGYGGHFFDHGDGGRLVVLTTGSVAAVQDQLEPDAPKFGPGFLVRATSFSDADLTDALARVQGEAAAPGGPLGDVTVHSAALNYDGPFIGIVVDESDLGRARHRRADVERFLGVPVRFSGGAAETEAACTSREYCSSPMKAGVVIRQGSTSGKGCTQGFHVVIGSDTQFVTAGHCGHTGSNDWYHKGYGSSRIGYELATLYAQNGVDIMRVQLWDSQESNMIFSDFRYVTGSRDPSQGEAVCASLGISNTVDCGTVSTTSTSWTGSECSCTINGADVDGITWQLGDSGSPIYHRTSSSAATGVGVMNTLSGKFAKLQGPLNFWGASVVSS